MKFRNVLKKFTAVTLIGVMLAGFAGCGKNVSVVTHQSYAYVRVRKCKFSGNVYYFFCFRTIASEMFKSGRKIIKQIGNFDSGADIKGYIAAASYFISDYFALGSYIFGSVSGHYRDV